MAKIPSRSALAILPASNASVLRRQLAAQLESQTAPSGGWTDTAWTVMESR
jgi:hypothetical protein